MKVGSLVHMKGNISPMGHGLVICKLPSKYQVYWLKKESREHAERRHRGDWYHINNLEEVMS